MHKEETQSQQQSKTPVIENFCTNITQKAIDGKIDPIFGRDDEIRKLSILLARRKKNNAMLIGEPGVGKTAIPEALAIHIIEKKVPKLLQNKRIFGLEVSSIMAGTKYRGQLEERIKTLLVELEANDDIILFIDEIHTIMSSGSGGNLDIANMLKPALAKGLIQAIGATTLDEYKKHIEKDKAMDRRFGKISVAPLSVADTVYALKILRPKYEAHHGIKFPDQIIEKIPELASRYIKDRFLPDSAIDIMDEIGAKLQILKSDNYVISDIISDIEKTLADLDFKKKQYIKQQRFSEIKELKDEINAIEYLYETEVKKINKENTLEATESDMRTVISDISKIPIDKMASDPKSKIIKLEEAFSASISGQATAKSKIIKALKRSIIGLSDPNKPISSFLFLGKTGTGKSLIAKVIASAVFDGSLIKVDMSEYMEKHNVSKMVGAPAGYIGYEEGGQLTEQVKRNPFSVILFDEIEKAHKDVYNTFLQILDEGRLTDSHGNVVDFTNTIIVMTSNLGVKENKINRVGFGAESTRAVDQEANITKAIKSHFSPEIINRLSSIVTFDDLTEENIAEILDIELESVIKLAANRKVKLKFHKKLKEKLSKEGYSEEYGARFLKRHIENILIDPIADYLMENNVPEGSTLSLSFNEKEDNVAIKLLK